MDEYFQQHPIPQQISSYEFRLVGDMTIKQFFQVAGGALAALFFYSTSLPVYFKMPLIIISFLAGLALAFFPFQDRPLSQWILLFVKAIYSPSIFIWNKLTLQHNYFQSDTPVAQTQKVDEHPDVKIPPPSTPKIPSHQEPITAVPQEPTKESLTLGKKSESKPMDQAPESARLEKSETEFLDKVAAQFLAITEDLKNPVIHVAPPTTSEIKRDPVKIPEKSVISIEKSEKPTLVSSPELKAAPQPSTQIAYKISPSVGVRYENPKAAEFSKEATPPAPSSVPNVIVGQVIDSEGKIVEGAIIEIRDFDGRPVRALRTNRLGHFMIATPLSNGKYILITEKDNLVYERIEVEAKGELIQPIAIRATAG